MKTKTITAEEFDRKFDNGENIDEYIDWSSGKKINTLKHRRINIDFPEWMIKSLDNEAVHIGISRQAVIKTWIAERLERRHS